MAPIATRSTPAHLGAVRIAAAMLVALLLGACSAERDHRTDWVIRSQVVFLSPDLQTERKQPPASAMRLWFPYVTGDLYGQPETGSFYEAAVRPDLTFEIDLNGAHDKVVKSAGRTVFSMRSLAIAPAEARIARMLPFVMQADGIEPLGETRWIDADTRQPLMLVYFDRKARIAGSEQSGERTLLYDIWTNEPGYLWVGQSDNKSTSEWSRARPKRVLLAVTPRNR